MDMGESSAKIRNTWERSRKTGLMARGYTKTSSTNTAMKETG